MDPARSDIRLRHKGLYAAIRIIRLHAILGRLSHRSSLGGSVQHKADQPFRSFPQLVCLSRRERRTCVCGQNSASELFQSRTLKFRSSRNPHSFLYVK